MVKLKANITDTMVYSEQSSDNNYLAGVLLTDLLKTFYTADHDLRTF